MTDKPLEQVLEDFRKHLKQEQDTPWYSKIGGFFKKRPYVTTAAFLIMAGGSFFAGNEVYKQYQATMAFQGLNEETKTSVKDIEQSIENAVAVAAGKHTGFEYSLIIYAKKTGGNTISYGESESEHENGNLCITGITEEQMREIVGERNYMHLKQNTDRGFTPVRYGREVDWKEAQEWTEITDAEAAEKLGKYCRQLENDLEYLTDNKIETGTFWKLKIRRHDKK